MPLPATVRRHAIFSDCRTWRYWLWRSIDDGLPLLLALMLNPSKANDVRDDPTTVYMANRAFADGFGRYVAVNLFATVATDPCDLRGFDDPVGPLTDHYILRGLDMADKVVVAWGSDLMLQYHKRRRGAVLGLLEDRELWCLGVNRDGNPRFPRAVSKEQPLILYAPTF